MPAGTGDGSVTFHRGKVTKARRDDCEASRTLLAHSLGVKTYVFLPCRGGDTPLSPVPAGRPEGAKATPAGVFRSATAACGGS